MALGNKLKQILDERGMTVKDFAAKIEVPPTTLYSFIKRDSQTGKLELIAKICKGLGIDLLEFLSSDEEMDEEGLKHVDLTHFAPIEAANIALLQLLKNKSITIENVETGESKKYKVKNSKLLAYFNEKEAFTDEETEKIIQFAEFIKSQRKD